MVELVVDTLEAIEGVTARAVTLTGPPGCGKTHVALAIAHMYSDKPLNTPYDLPASTPLPPLPLTKASVCVWVDGTNRTTALLSLVSAASEAGATLGARDLEEKGIDVKRWLECSPDTAPWLVVVDNLCADTCNEVVPLLPGKQGRILVTTTAPESVADPLKELTYANPHVVALSGWESLSCVGAGGVGGGDGSNTHSALRTLASSVLASRESVSGPSVLTESELSDIEASLHALEELGENSSDNNASVGACAFVLSFADGLLAYSPETAAELCGYELLGGDGVAGPSESERVNESESESESESGGSGEGDSDGDTSDTPDDDELPATTATTTTTTTAAAAVTTAQPTSSSTTTHSTVAPYPGLLARLTAELAARVVSGYTSDGWSELCDDVAAVAAAVCASVLQTCFPAGMLAHEQRQQQTEDEVESGWGERDCDGGSALTLGSLIAFSQLACSSELLVYTALAASGASTDTVSCVGSDDGRIPAAQRTVGVGLACLELFGFAHLHGLCPPPTYSPPPVLSSHLVDVVRAYSTTRHAGSNSPDTNSNNAEGSGTAALQDPLTVDRVFMPSSIARGIRAALYRTDSAVAPLACLLAGVARFFADKMLVYGTERRATYRVVGAAEDRNTHVLAPLLTPACGVAGALHHLREFSLGGSLPVSIAVPADVFCRLGAYAFAHSQAAFLGDSLYTLVLCHEGQDARHVRIVGGLHELARAHCFLRLSQLDSALTSYAEGLTQVVGEGGASLIGNTVSTILTIGEESHSLSDTFGTAANLVCEGVLTAVRSAGPDSDEEDRAADVAEVFRGMGCAFMALGRLCTASVSLDASLTLSRSLKHPVRVCTAAANKARVYLEWRNRLEVASTTEWMRSMAELGAPASPLDEALLLLQAVLDQRQQDGSTQTTLCPLTRGRLCMRIATCYLDRDGESDVVSACKWLVEACDVFESVYVLHPYHPDVGGAARLLGSVIEKLLVRGVDGHVQGRAITAESAIQAYEKAGTVYCVLYDKHHPVVEATAASIFALSARAVRQ